MNANVCITRRQALKLATALGVSGCISGCGSGSNGLPVSTKTANAAAEATIAVGGVIFAIPHPAGKIIGATLIVAGSVLKVYLTTVDGERVEVDVKLNEDQKRAVEKAATSGEKATVKQADGETDVVPVETH